MYINQIIKAESQPAITTSYEHIEYLIRQLNLGQLDKFQSVPQAGQISTDSGTYWLSNKIFKGGMISDNLLHICCNFIVNLYISSISVKFLSLWYILFPHDRNKVMRIKSGELWNNIGRKKRCIGLTWTNGNLVFYKERLTNNILFYHLLHFRYLFRLKTKKLTRYNKDDKHTQNFLWKVYPSAPSRSSRAARYLISVQE